MQFEFQVSAEAEREEGKFSSRDDIETLLVEALEGADPGSVEGENGGTYAIVTWDVQALETAKQTKKKGVFGGPEILQAWRLIRQTYDAAMDAGANGNVEESVKLLDRLNGQIDHAFLLMTKAKIIELT